MQSLEWQPAALPPACHEVIYLPLVDVPVLRRYSYPMSALYDSLQETLDHIANVQAKMADCIARLMRRASVHDRSKLGPEEKPLFDAHTPGLKETTYGSEEYKARLASLKPALDHHYAHNSHHPEFYENGVDDMSLLDVVEMLCDWKAASERHADGDILRSLVVNRERFKISDQLYALMLNTVHEMGWMPEGAALTR